MCRAKSDPRGWYRCDWGKGARESLETARNVSAGVLSKALTAGDDSFPELSTILGQARDSLCEEVEKAMEEKPLQYHTALRLLELLRNHLMCDIAALIGQACADLGEIVPNLAKDVGKLVKQTTDSRFLGACAEKVVETWIRMLPPVVAGTHQVKFVGMIADTLAVGLCPAMPRHDGVRKSEQRLNAGATAALLKKGLGGNPE